MTVRFATRPSDVIFDVSANNIQITKVLDGQTRTFVSDDPSCLTTIQRELEWLAQHQSGVFRLFYMTLAPWSEISEMFIHYAQMYGITL